MGKRTNLTPAEIKKLEAMGVLSSDTAASLASGEDQGDGAIGVKTYRPGGRANQQHGGAKKKPHSEEMSEIQALKAKMRQNNRDSDIRVLMGIQGSEFIMDPNGLVKMTDLPQKFQKIRGAKGEMPYGLDASQVTRDDLMRLGFSQEQATEMHKARPYIGDIRVKQQIDAVRNPQPVAVQPQSQPQPPLAVQPQPQQPQAMNDLDRQRQLLAIARTRKG
jgi:hypothetical protein